MSFAAGYNVAKDVGNNIAAGFRQSKDTNAIETILSQAMSTGNQEDLNDAIGQIMSQVSPERQGDAIKVLQQTYQNIDSRRKEQRLFQDEQRKRQADERLGLDPDLDPAIKKEQFKQKSYDRRANEVFGGNGLQNVDSGDNSPPEISNINEPKKQLKDLPKDELIKGLSIPGLGKSFQAELDRREHEEKLEQDAKIANRKEVTASYGENKEYINKIYDQYEDSIRREAILDRMSQLEESGELSESGITNLLESLGLQQEWLKNPANEEYTKLSLDLLGGGTLQADYGSRVLQSEFKVSQQRIPTLMQTAEGRKQISENIKAMLLPAKLKKERMQYYLDKSQRTGEPLPHDLRGTVLRDIKPQLEEAYDAFKQRNGRYKVKKGTVPSDNDLDKYYYLGDGDEKKILKLMQEDGFNVTD